MNRNPKWKAYGWRHDLWELVRYYRSLRKGGDAWVSALQRSKSLGTGDGITFPVAEDVINALSEYVQAGRVDFDAAFADLRSEDEARECCTRLGVEVGITATRSADHHQS